LSCIAGGLFDDDSGAVSRLTENVFRYAIWRVNQQRQQQRGRKFAYDIQTVPADSFHTTNKGLNSKLVYVPGMDCAVENDGPIVPVIDE